MMRIFSILCIALFFVTASPHTSLAASGETIAIVVNDGVITKSDMDDRIRMIMVSSGLPNRPDILNNLAPQVISSLIDEQIRLQEAERLELKVSQGEINEGLSAIAKNNNFEPAQFRDVMTRSGINVASLEDQIRAQIAWRKVVQSRLTTQVNVSERDVENALERMQNNIGKTEYLLAEIFLPVDDAKEERNVQQLAQKLVREIQSGARFSQVAQQFSKSAGASQGGDMGWIQQGQLSEALDNTVVAMQPGQLSEPVRSLSGYHILFVREQRVISEETVPDRSEIRNVLGQQRLENLARRYFLDLKSTAFVDNRLGS